MNRIHPHSLGLALGILFAVLHAGWSVLVLLGIAQWLLDTIFSLHMLLPAITVAPFNVTSAIILIIVTGIIGYIVGWLFGTIWNRYAVK